MRILSSLVSLGLATAVQPNEHPLTFKIDLSLPPNERFTEVAVHFKDHVEEMRDFMYGKIGWLGAFIAKAIWSLDVLIPSMQPERYHEIKGFFSTIDMEVWEGMAINYVYEYGAFCTSIVARQADGTIIHGRNLDFALTKYIRNLTYHAEFYDGEHFKYSANMFAGHMGVFTGFKSGGFSISENERIPSVQKNLW